MKNPTVLETLNEKEVNDDEAHAIANQAWMDYIQSKDLSADGSQVNFVDYLKMMGENAKGFVYDVAKDGNGEVVGAVWQTATMRDNFERFGGYSCLDVMKREINTLEWPYISLTMRNELEQVCVGAEGIP